MASHSRTLTRLGGLAIMLTLLAAVGGAEAQDGQGKYITQAADRLATLVSLANKDGYQLQPDDFSVGGGWLKQSKDWVGLFSVELKGKQPYRFLAAGDDDAKDVDLRILDPDGKEVAIDAAVGKAAVVNFTPPIARRYRIQVRVYESNEGAPCACLAIIMNKK
jgi:hypothetical protein